MDIVKRIYFVKPFPRPFSMMRKSSAEAEACANAFKASVIATRAEERGEHVEGELSSNASAVMNKAVNEPDTLLTKIYSDLNLHPAEGKKAIDELIGRGYARIHHISRRGRGAMYGMLEILHTADEEIAKRGIVRPKPLLKGGFLHDAYARVISKYLREKGHRHWFEKTLGDKQFDIVYEE